MSASISVDISARCRRWRARSRHWSITVQLRLNIADKLMRGEAMVLLSMRVLMAVLRVLLFNG
jgi:hypothetical protein